MNSHHRPLIVPVTAALIIIGLTSLTSPLLAADPVQEITFSPSSTNLDVPYVQTPEPLVLEMLKMAEVSDQDVVYDLGCGDGRFVVLAAKHYGTRGVGIDLDPDRIQEAEQNAKETGVADQVRFIHQNIFEADIREATVVTLYLLSSVNLKLRPHLLKQLKPGSRVVSHAFAMGSWQPDRTEHFKWGVFSATAYLWMVPADFRGEWRGQLSHSQDGDPLEFRIHAAQEFQEVRGTLHLNDQAVPLADGRLQGDRVTFTTHWEKGHHPVQDFEGAIAFSGRIEGNAVAGEFSQAGGVGELEDGIWSATLVPPPVPATSDTPSPGPSAATSDVKVKGGTE